MTKQEFIEKNCKIVYSPDLKCNICTLKDYYICLESLMENSSLLDYLYKNDITVGLGHVNVSMDDNSHDYKYAAANVGYSIKDKAWHGWTADNDFWQCRYEYELKDMDETPYLPCSKDEHISWMISLILKKYPDAVPVVPVEQDEKGFCVTMNITQDNADPVIRQFEFDWLDDYNNIPLGFVCKDGNDCIAVVTQFLKKAVNKLNYILV